MELLKNRTHLFSCLLIIVLGTIIYSNSFYGEFQFDDGVHIVQQNKFNDLSLYSEFSSWTRINDRPLSYFTLAINRSLNGTNVFGYHVFNLMVHLLTSILVYFFTLLLLSQKVVHSNKIIGKEKLTALFIALIFLCHPIQTQAVSYIIQRMTSLAGLFYIASSFFYLKARLSQVKGELYIKFVSFYVLTIITAIASVLSKQIAVTLPIAFLLIEFFFIRNNEGKRFNKLLLTGVIAILISSFVVILGGLLPKETESISRYEYFITQIRVIVKYVQLLVLPISQNLDYDFVISKSLWGIDELISGVVVISLLVSAFTIYRKHPLISYGIAWFFITLMVESSIIPIRDVIFEHRLYLPMMGFAIILVLALIELLRKIKQGQLIMVFSLIIVVYGCLTLVRNTVWKTKLALWYDVVQKSPAKARPHLNLGIAYFHLFKPVPAIEQFNIANKIEPENDQVYYNRAEALLVLNRTEDAIRDLNQSISLNDKFAEAFDTRGIARLRMKDFDAAIDDCSKAIELKPELESAWFNRANAYLFKGEIQNALNDLNKAIQLNPNFAAALNNRGQVMLNLGKYEDAIIDLNKALEIEPRLSNAYNNRAKAFYAIRRFDLSIKDLNTSLQFNAKDGEVLKLRGICYLEQNNFEQAYSDFLKAMEYGAQIDETLLENCKQRLIIQK
ncbi:MAG: tetratricopeptide repeat protein [Bacteroidetes bacterium]|nr:tetratricopeptide repeat protein [Bacteroidota bacterium]